MPTEHPSRHITLMTRKLYQPRRQSVTRNSSPTLKAITIDNIKNLTSLDYANLFKTLKGLLDDRIKPAMIAQFSTLQNMFTQSMGNIMD